MKDVLADAWTVAQKELRELLATRRSSPAGLLMIALIVLFLGIILPLQAGVAWLNHPWLLSLWAWLPVFIVTTIVADSVAGERERHTLETLLASRLPDRAILLGKVGAAVLYGWGVMLITIIVSIIAINVVYARDSFLLYRPLLLIGGGVLSLLASILAAAFGVLVSLRADSVRRAQQIVLVVLFSAFLIHIAGLPLVSRLLPVGLHETFTSVIGLLGRIEVVAALAMLLVLVDILLMALATSWFRRDRLNLH